MPASELQHRRTRLWATTLEPELGAAAVAVAREVAVRSVDSSRLVAAIEASPRQSAFPEVQVWQPYAIAQGDAGVALMCGYLDACFPGEQWDVLGHRFLTTAARAAEQIGLLAPGLFGGLGGLAFATWSLSRGGTRYGRLLASLEDALVPNVLALADEARRRRSVPVGHFDAISGIGGVGAYLLGRRERPELREALDEVLATLVELTEPRDGLPGWHTPAGLAADETMAQQFPNGSLNCGLAHGIPGPLALMALASLHGVEAPGQADALRRTCDWLAEHRAEDEWGVNWPSAVPADWAAAPGSGRALLQPSRAAWCYGSPGVARALWLAGEALAEPPLKALAVEAMEAVYRRPVAERRIDSPTFCHGVAGLLQITLRFGGDTGLRTFGEAADALTRQLLAAYEPERLLGYSSIEPGGNHVDQPGFLDGAPGVAMVLLAAATDVEPGWDRVFLLA